MVRNRGNWSGTGENVQEQDNLQQNMTRNKRSREQRMIWSGSEGYCQEQEDLVRGEHQFMAREKEELVNNSRIRQEQIRSSTPFMARKRRNDCAEIFEV